MKDLVEKIGMWVFWGLAAFPMAMIGLFGIKGGMWYLVPIALIMLFLWTWLTILASRD